MADDEDATEWEFSHPRHAARPGLSDRKFLGSLLFLSRFFFCFFLAAVPRVVAEGRTAGLAQGRIDLVAYAAGAPNTEYRVLPCYASLLPFPARAPTFFLFSFFLFLGSDREKDDVCRRSRFRNRLFCQPRPTRLSTAAAGRRWCSAIWRHWLAPGLAPPPERGHLAALARNAGSAPLCRPAERLQCGRGWRPRSTLVDPKFFSSPFSPSFSSFFFSSSSSSSPPPPLSLFVLFFFCLSVSLFLFSLLSVLVLCVPSDSSDGLLFGRSSPSQCTLPLAERASSVQRSSSSQCAPPPVQRNAFHSDFCARPSRLARRPMQIATMVSVVDGPTGSGHGPVVVARRFVVILSVVVVSARLSGRHDHHAGSRQRRSCLAALLPALSLSRHAPACFLLPSTPSFLAVFLAVLSRLAPPPTATGAGRPLGRATGSDVVRVVRSGGFFFFLVV